MTTEKLISVLIVELISISLGIILCHGVKTYLRKSRRNENHVYRSVGYRILKVMVIVINIIIFAYQIPSLQNAVSVLLASSGVLALGVTYAAQESLTNLIDGILIAIYKPFNIGDRITLPEKNNLTGIVSSMNLRHTVITTYNNSSFIISNSVISTAIVENSNFHNESFSYPIDVTISYDSDIDLAMKVMAEVICSHPDYIDLRTEEQKAEGKCPATVLVRELGDNGLALRCQMITKDVNSSFRACSEVRVNLKKAFDANGIVIPFTTITINNRQEDNK